MSYSEIIEGYIRNINEALLFFTKDEKGLVGEAMRYSLMNGGKRVRPVLALMTSQCLCDDWQPALIPSLSLEMVHTYSLIHDDLPCMDDDDFRRGKPSCHKKYGENIAVLAGDALLTYAFKLLSDLPDSLVAINCIRVLSDAAGNSGMIHGQELDFMDYKDLDSLKNINRNKTGRMITASVLLGANAAQRTDEDTISVLKSFSDKIGEVFQIVDDILDVTSTQDILGKPINSDIKNNKPTYVSLFGIDNAKKYASELTEEACDNIKQLNADTSMLSWYAKQLLVRIK